MKVKQKHRDIARTMSYFCDRIEYGKFADFEEPTEEQIEAFTRIETLGRKGCLDSDYILAAPLIDGKTNYDLQLKMLHETLAEYVCNGWGWHPVIVADIEDIQKDFGQDGGLMKIYLKALYKIKENIENTCAFDVLMAFSGFTAEQKNNIANNYYNSLLTNRKKTV